MNLRKWLFAILITGALCIPAAAMAQAEDVNANAQPAAAVPQESVPMTAASPAPVQAAPVQYVYVQAPAQPVMMQPEDERPTSAMPTSDDDMRAAFSLLMNVGPYYAIKEKQLTSGGSSVEFPGAGLEAALDIGFTLKYFGAYLELMLRGGAVMADDPHYHCPQRITGADDICFKYLAVEQGDWDGYFAGAGIMLYGFIPLSKSLFLSLGVGFLGYFGLRTDRDKGVTNHAAKFSLGINATLTDHIAIGAALQYEGLTGRQSIQPAFNLIYNY